MQLYKITHTNGIINWVNGPNKDGAENVFLSPSVCGDVMANKTHYLIVAGACQRRPENEIEAEEAEKNNLIEIERQRLLDILSVQESIGLKQYTITQAESFIDNKIDPAITVDELKIALKEVLKKMIPYIL